MVISGKKQARMPQRSPLRPLLRAIVIVKKMKMTQANEDDEHQRNANTATVACDHVYLLSTDGTSSPVGAALVPLTPGGAALARRRRASRHPGRSPRRAPVCERSMSLHSRGPLREPRRKQVAYTLVSMPWRRRPDTIAAPRAEEMTGTPTKHQTGDFEAPRLRSPRLAVLGAHRPPRPPCSPWCTATASTAAATAFSSTTWRRAATRCSPSIFAVTAARRDAAVTWTALPTI